VSWPMVSLGEVVGLRTGPFGSALHQNDYVAGGVPLINPTHIRDGRFSPDSAVAVGPEKFRELQEFSVEVGDILMGRRGEMGRCAVVTGAQRGWLCGTGSIIVRPTTKIDSNFLQRFLSASSTARALESDSVGTTMVNLNQKILLALRLALPPIVEQRRIAAILDKADALRAKRREAIAKLDQLLQSVFLEMFGDPKLNGKSWPTQDLDSLVVVDAPLVDPRDLRYKAMLHFGPDRIERDTGRLLTAKTAEEDGLISKKFLCDDRHILYSKIRPYLNKVALVTRPCLCSADVYPVEPKKGKLTRRFLWHILRSKDFLDHADFYSNRANIPKINRNQFLSYQCIVPPYEVQERFDFISKIFEKLAAKTHAASEQIECLFSSFQQSAFAGTL